MKFFIIALLALAIPAFAGPLSGCATNNNPCNIYETNSDGLPSEVGNVFALAVSVTPGYVVLMDSGSPVSITDQANLDLWSDVLWFLPGVTSGLSTTAQFLSRGCNVGTGDISCFPTFATVSDAPHAFMLENPVNPTVYIAGDHVYNMFSDPDTQTPEPATFALMAAGLLAMFYANKRRLSFNN